MKYLKYLPYFILIIVLLYGFKSDTTKDQFQKMKTLTQIIRLVTESYVEEVDMNNILEGAIVGLLDRLDPHSIYISEEQSEVINEQFAGEFEGIWIEFNILNGYITVISPIPGTPSDRAGLQSGDKIVRIKANYKTQCRSGTEDMHTTPHIDMRLQQDGSPDGFRVEFPHTVIIYYVNDSDGDTFLFNSNGTEMTRVEPKKGRFLIFDGQIYHAGSFPIHHLDRIVINYNIE